MKLTEKQKRFADYYIELGDQAEAYIRAGYKVSNKQSARAAASRLLTNVNVSAYISGKMAEKDAERVAKQDEILEFLTSVLRGDETEEVVVVEGQGQGYSEARKMDKNISAKDRIKAAELIGKRYGIWLDRQQVEGSAVVQIMDNVPKDKP